MLDSNEKTSRALKRETEIEDYNESEGEDSQLLNYIAEDEREVYIDTKPMSIFELHRRYKRGEIELNPDYQRKDVWNDVKKSKLVESVLRNIPIPAIYLSEREDGIKEVIDGQQRLNTFFEFLENKIELRKLPVLYDLNRNYFNNLDVKYQRRIEDYIIHVFIIKKESHPDIKFDIFERINEGASHLNAQELRNCTFRGEGIDLIKKLANDESFKRVIGNKLQKKRSKDEEAILRFLSFYLKSYSSYKGNLNSFLNETLRSFDTYKYQLKNIEKTFVRTMMLIYEVFGDKAFIKSDSTRKKVNISLFDIITVSFAKSNYNKVKQDREAIIKALEDLMSDKEFYMSITSSTLSISNVNVRFEKWYKVMNKYMEVESK